MKNAIKLAIEGGWKLKVLPKGDTIVLWLLQKVRFLGIKVGVLQQLESAIFARVLLRSISTGNSTLSSAEDTTGTSLNMAGFSQMKKLVKNLELPNLNGLAKELGITKEGVQRLIWLLGDVRNTKDGSGAYSSETISLVRSAVL